VRRSFLTMMGLGVGSGGRAPVMSVAMATSRSSLTSPVSSGHSADSRSGARVAETPKVTLMRQGEHNLNDRRTAHENEGAEASSDRATLETGPSGAVAHRGAFDHLSWQQHRL
jgi:hypothetical protein